MGGVADTAVGIGSVFLQLVNHRLSLAAEHDMIRMTEDYNVSDPIRDNILEA